MKKQYLDAEKASAILQEPGDNKCFANSRLRGCPAESSQVLHGGSRKPFHNKNKKPRPLLAQGTRPKQYRQHGKAVAQYRPQGYCTTKTPRCIVSCTYFGQRGVFFMSFFTFSTVIFTGIPRPEMIRASSAYIFTASIAAPPFCCIHTRAAAAVCGRRRAA